MSCPGEGLTRIEISTSSPPFSSVRSRRVSSTCVTASAPGGSGAPVLILTQWPGFTVFSGWPAHKLVSYLAGALSPVDHKELHQG